MILMMQIIIHDFKIKASGSEMQINLFILKKKAELADLLKLLVKGY